MAKKSKPQKKRFIVYIVFAEGKNVTKKSVMDYDDLDKATAYIDKKASQDGGSYIVYDTLMKRQEYPILNGYVPK